MYICIYIYKYIYIYISESTQVQVTACYIHLAFVLYFLSFLPACVSMSIIYHGIISGRAHLNLPVILPLIFQVDGMYLRPRPVSRGEQGFAQWDGTLHVTFPLWFVLSLFNYALLGSFLIPWFNFKSRLDIWLHYMWDKITYQYPNLNGCAVEVWELISSFISHFTRHMLTHPCWD